MKFKIRIDSSEELGTFYGIYSGSNLVHKEFARSTAEEILNKLNSGSSLYDIFYEQAKKEHLRLSKPDVERMQKRIIDQEKRIKELELKVQKDANKQTVVQPNYVQSAPPIKRECRKCQLMNKFSLQDEMAEELADLILEVESLNFSLSSELSNYITQNSLGKKYPNISGSVTMQNGCDTWSLNGGFPRNIYRIICQELSLHGKGTTAQAVGFRSYKSMQNSMGVS